MDLASLQAKLMPDPRVIARNGAIIAAASLVLSLGASLLIKVLVAVPAGAHLKEPLVTTPEKAAVTSTEPAPVPDRLPTEAAAPRKLAKRSYLDPILKRSIFDSSAIGATESKGEVTGDGRKTDLKVVLLATVVAWPEEYSSCLVSSGEGNDAKVEGYGIGDQLLGEATILQIQQKKVIIRRTDGTVEYLAMGDEVAKKEDTTAKATDAGGVEKSGDNKFTIESSVLQDALSNIEALAGQVRATPHRGPDGNVDGFRLSSIRRGSLMQKLGIKNGDIVHSVNGVALSDTNAAMGAYQSLQNERHFTFEITRRNQKQTFEYDIR